MDTPTPEWRTGSISFCWICGLVVDLRTCKTDEHGNAVHEACYATRIRMNDEALKQMQICLRSNN
jgi:hypothetical protein